MKLTTLLMPCTLLLSGMVTTPLQAAARRINPSVETGDLSNGGYDIVEKPLPSNNGSAASTPLDGPSAPIDFSEAPVVEIPMLYLTHNCKGEARERLEIPLASFVETATTRALGAFDLQTLLTSYNIDINGTNEHGETLLKQACRMNYLPAVHVLCSCAGINLNKADKYGNTPMTDACKHGAKTSLDLLALLLSRRADINGKVTKLFADDTTRITWPVDTPLSLMINANQIDHVKWLIARGANLGEDNRANLRSLLSYGNLDEEMRAVLIAAFAKKPCFLFCS